MNPKKIVVDTNVLISAALNRKGITAKTLSKAYKLFKIVQNEETYQELTSRINKRKFDNYLSNEDRQNFLETLHQNSQFIETKSKINDCRDPDDNKFLELAQDSNAQFLITGDKDLFALTSQPKYQNLIISPRDFLELDLSKL